MHQEEYIRVDALTHLPDILSRRSVRRVFLVTGNTSYVASGGKEAMERYLHGLEIVHFHDFRSNTSIEDVQQGIALFLQHEVDVVIAVGGGSVMDMAKAIVALARQEQAPEEYVTGRETLVPSDIPLIALPTTAGSGSEATHFAVVYIGEKKYSLAHPSLLPAIVLVDPTLTYSLPSRIVAATGFDALSQAIESYWSVRSTDESRAYAREAIPLVLAYLSDAVKGDKQARNAMSRAAHLAGKAINISKTTASHAMSYPLTVHLGIPHGHAVALTLSRVLVYNSKVRDDDVQDPRGREYVARTMGELYALLGVGDPETAGAVIDTLLRDVSLEHNLATWQVDEEKIAAMLDGFSQERAANNPRVFTKEHAHNIFHELV